MNQRFLLTKSSTVTSLHTCGSDIPVLGLMLYIPLSASYGTKNFFLEILRHMHVQFLSNVDSF